MLKAVTQLWRGGLQPATALGAGNDEYKLLEELRQHICKKLEEELGGPVAKTFEKYNECLSQQREAIGELAFCDGFCLGMRLAMEALSGAEEEL